METQHSKKKRRRIRKTWIQIWTIQPWHIIWTSYWKSLTLCLLFGKMGITIPVLWMLLKNWINTCKLYVCVLSSHSVVSDSLQPMDCSPPGSSVYGILQARTLKWVATSSSRRSSRPRDWIHVSCTGRWALHCWATREARILHHCAVMMSPGQLGEKEKSRGFVPKWKIVSISKIFCRLTVTFKAGVLWNILKFWFCHINQMINSWGSWMKLWALQKVKRRHLCRKRDNKKAMGAEPYRMSKWETEKAREETAIHRGISQCVCMYVKETERDRERESRERTGRREMQPRVGYPVRAGTALTALHMAVLCFIAQSCPTLCNHLDCSLPGSSVHKDSPSKNTGVGCHAHLQRIFPTQGSNPGHPHCTWILYHLSNQESPRILEWVAYSFFRTSPEYLPSPGIELGSPAFLWQESPVDSLPAELPEKLCLT